jgi:PmbA protein
MERFELSQELGREILDKAKAKGASQGDVVMAESDSFFVTVRMGEVEKISQAGEKRLGLRLFFGNSSASASTSDISRKSIEKLVDDTARMARVTAQDPHGGLPEAADLARDCRNWICSTSRRERFRWMRKFKSRSIRRTER